LFKGWENDINEMINNSLEINKIYSTTQVQQIGLIPKKAEQISSRVFVMDEKVYFFEYLKNDKLRLFSIINEKSFFL